MNLYCCANYLMCQRILVLRIGHSRFAIYLCVLCASVVNPPDLVAITVKNQAVPSSALRFFYFNRIRYTTASRLLATLVPSRHWTLAIRGYNPCQVDRHT